jgi:hypothetical protein
MIAHLTFVQLVPIGVPPEDLDDESLFAPATVDLSQQDISHSAPAIPAQIAPVDVCQRVYVHLSGLALNCNPSTTTFTFDIDVWVSSLRDAKDAASKSLRPVASVLCTILDSNKYRNGKPMPYNRRYVSVCGYLTSAAFRNEQREEGVTRFHVSVDQIAFLGQQSTPSTMIVNTLDSKPLVVYTLTVHSQYL